MKYLIIIPDGMADLPIEEIGMKTPLQAARAENLNRLASMGSSGLMDPISPGRVPDSDTAHLAILGYDPETSYTGRGPLEAAGAGVRLTEGDVAYRCNICELDRGGLILNEKADLSKEELGSAVNAINGDLRRNFADLEVQFVLTVAYRGILVLRGRNVSPAVRTKQPKKNEKLSYPEPELNELRAETTAKMLRYFMDVSERVLNESLKRDGKRYAIIPWGGGVSPRLMSFKDMYNLNAAGIAGVPLIRGICKLCGIDSIDVPGATGGPDTDLNGKADAALRALEDHDLVLIHVEATDELSHDGDVSGKIEMIRKIDLMVGKMTDNIDIERVRIAVLPDHTTSCELRSHTSDPVPVTIAGGGYPKDGIFEYSETSCIHGGLGRFRGKDFLRLFFRLKS